MAEGAGLTFLASYHAQAYVEAGRLQRVLAGALVEGGWFDTAHNAAIADAVAAGDPADRARAVKTLMAEETRLAMLVGVAVGLELGRELGLTDETTQEE